MFQAISNMDNSAPQTPQEPGLGEFHIFTSEEARGKATPELIHKLRLIKKRQYAGILSLVAIVALGGYIVSKVPEFAGDVRTQAGVQKPKPTPLYCNAGCGTGEILCPRPLKCVNGFCRNTQCEIEESCLCQASPIPDNQ